MVASYLNKEELFTCKYCKFGFFRGNAIYTKKCPKCQKMNNLPTKNKPV